MARSKRSFRSLPGIFAVLALSVLAARIRASAPTEYQVKAAYLYNFGLFVQWPSPRAAQSDAAFTICVLGVDPFGKALDKVLAGQTIGSESAVARRISDPQDALGCRILFISASEETNVKQLLSSLGKSSVLTVSDMSKFVERGGMIQFVLVNNRVRFEVNLAAAGRSGLTLSSQLVKLAVRVERSLPLGD